MYKVWAFTATDPSDISSYTECESYDAAIGRMRNIITTAVSETERSWTITAIVVRNDNQEPATMGEEGAQPGDVYVASMMLSATIH